MVSPYATYGDIRSNVPIHDSWGWCALWGRRFRLPSATESPNPKKRLRTPLEFEHHIQRHDEFGVFRAEDRGLRRAFGSAVITLAGARIDDPDVGNSEGKIVVH